MTPRKPKPRASTSPDAVAPGLVIKIDTREPEHTAYRFDDLGIQTIRGKLDAGDYAPAGPRESRVSFERKTVPDLVSTVIANRARFIRELSRLSTYDLKGIVIEGTNDDIVKYVQDIGYRHGLSPAAIAGRLNTIATSLRRWFRRYKVPYFLLGSRDKARRWVADVLMDDWRAEHPRARGTRPVGEAGWREAALKLGEVIAKLKRAGAA